jgi:MFS family permease
LFILVLFSVAAPLNQFKVPPVLPLLMQSFSLSVGSASLLMSVFALTGLVLALPSGFIFQRLGYRLTGLLAAGAVVIGSTIGATSGVVGTMLVGRVVEGAGTSLTAVVAPAVIAMWFAAEERGTPLGIWATWVPLGSTLMLVIAPMLAGQFGWRSVWWFGTVYTLVVGALYVTLIRPAAMPADTDGRAKNGPSTTADLARALRNRDLWLVSLVFGAFNFVLIAFVTWAPSFLSLGGRISLAQASLLTSMAVALNLASNPLSGWVSDRIGSRKWVCIVPLVIMATLWPLAFRRAETGFLPLVIVLGFVGGFVPTGVFTAGVEVVGDERLSGMAMAVILVGQNAGILLGPLAFGWLVQGTGSWQAASWMLVPVTLAGTVAALLARVR